MGAITRGPGFAFTSFENTFISIWRQQANLTSLRMVRECQKQVIDRTPGGIAVVTVMEPVSVKPLDSAERAEASAIARDFAPSTLASVYIFEGEGFRPAMSRAAVAGVMLFSRVKYPHKVFSTVDAGATWLKEKLATLDLKGLIGCIEEAREQIR
jgi:hypothetical protein